MIKVLVISTVNFGYGGGITNVIMNYYHSIDKSKVHMDFVVSKCIDDKLKQEVLDGGSKLYELSYRLKSPLKYLKKVKEIIKSGEYDIVHAHGNSCTLAIEMIAAKKGGAKIRIPHCHNTTTNYKVVHKLLRNKFDKNYTNGFACGEKAGEWLYAGKPFTVVNNGIDVKRYMFNDADRQKYRRKLGFDGCKVVGNVGAINYQKNHEFLVDIFSELYKLDNSYRLLIVGDGNLRSDVNNKIARLGLTNAVTFTGKSREVPQLMQAMDMIVMPSRYEGLPLTLLEAQSSCLQCFVSDVITQEAGVTDLVKYVSLEKQPKEWAKIINDTEAVNRGLQKNECISQITASGYNIEENAKTLKDLYQDFLNT
ncbi:glycosyltransferase family 1 protein [Peribacillus frigoritolerans]|uniref:glycosyltransferase family 1 protein n=1 Tax=Peribacillus frigoritolerans TaxID=450367 RepID=UPI00203E1EBF|nr:glycosyltransferase family 1 protein [Peribacillus frigoritolerans]MCM3166364.1 glycosyltransferase family 1 protein [Peribacillus frigoritolerans]